MTEPDHDATVAELETKLADPAWRLAMEIYVGELMQEYATYHQAQVQAICDWAAQRQMNRSKTQLTKRYLIDRLSEVRKSAKGPLLPQGTKHPNTFNETLWIRDGDGKFAHYTGDHPELQRRNWNGATNVTQGVKAGPEPDRRRVIAQNLAMRGDSERNAAHSVYGQINPPFELPANVTQGEHEKDVNDKFSEMTWGLAEATGDPSLKQRVQFVISSPDGFHRIETPPAGKMPNIDLRSERVQYMTPVGPDNPVTVAGKAVNIGYLAGMDASQSNKMGAVANDVDKALRSTDWGTKLQATAHTMEVLTNYNKTASHASAIAQLIGVLGPGGSRAFGNKLQQLSYRYLGQEVPEEAWGAPAKEGRQPDSKGNPEPIRAYELKLARDLRPSIPSSAQYKLALQAGSTPPSRGYLLDRQGNVVNESVGYASDWFTPFDLRELPKVRGGSYVRTRGYGGITPEDLRLAMRTGAQRVTVVSNNGVFTMEFNRKAMHFGHRYGYAGNAMIRRYAKALDAIRGNQVELPNGTIAPGQNKATMKLDADGYIAAMRDLQMRNPYFIKADSETNPMYTEVRDLGLVKSNESTGATAHDSGYMGPLDLYPKEAHGGWWDEAAQDLNTSNTGKYSYTGDQRSQLMHDRLMKASNSLGVAVGPDGRQGARAHASTAGARANGGGAYTGTNYVVDQRGIRRDPNTNQAIDIRSGAPISEYDAARQTAQLRASGSPLVRPGVYGGGGSSDQRPQGITYTQVHSNTPLGVSQADPTYNNPAAAAGAVSSVSAYTPDDDAEHMDGLEANAAVEDVRELMRHLKANGIVPKDIDDYDYAGEANRALFPANNNNPQGTKAYSDFTEKVRTSRSFREGLQSELREILGGHSLRGRVTVVPSEVFAQLNGATYESEAEKAPFDAPGEGHVGSEIPVLAHELDDFNVQEWRDKQKEIAEDSGNLFKQQEARKILHDFKLYRAVLRRAEKQRQDAKGGFIPPIEDAFHTEEDRSAYNRLNDRIAQIIKHGYQMDYDAGIETQPDEMFVPDLGRHTSGGNTPYQSRRISVADVQRGMAPADIANDHYVAMAEKQSGPELAASLRQQAGQYESFGNSRDKQGKTDAGQYWDVATELKHLAQTLPPLS